MSRFWIRAVGRSRLGSGGVYLHTFAADVVGVTHARNIRMQSFKRRLGVMIAHRHRLSYFLVDDHVDLHALRGLALEQHVEAPFRVLRRRTAQVQFGREPPILKGGPRGGDQYYCVQDEEPHRLMS